MRREEIGWRAAVGRGRGDPTPPSPFPLSSSANLVGLASIAAPLALPLALNASTNSPRRAPTSVGFFAPPHADAVALALAAAWQSASDVHLARPPVERVEEGVRDACAKWSRCRLSEGELWEMRLQGRGSNATRGRGAAASSPPPSREPPPSAR